MRDNKVIKMGAGLADSLLAIYLAKRGIVSDVFEARPDMNKLIVDGGRSINLGLSARSILALKEIGLDKDILSEAIPLRGRTIHQNPKKPYFIPYCERINENLYSISRDRLNLKILQEAKKYPAIKFYFNEQCTSCNFDSRILEFSSGKMVHAQTIFATDGVGSVIRQSMQSKLANEFKSEFLKLAYGYKEIHLLCIHSGQYPLEKNAFNIWPQENFMMLAAPNFDASFTCTLFMKHHGEHSFESIQNGEYGNTGDMHKSMHVFLRKYLPDILDLMPHYDSEFFKNPIAHLGSVKCFPWHLGNQALLLGDAAHAMAPFYAQVINCAFEDCRILNTLLDNETLNWEDIFKKFTLLRHKETDAINEMSMENFDEMQKSVTDPIFLLERALEIKLEERYPEYFSKYSMATFCLNIPYSLAQKRGKAQDDFLMNLCLKKTNINSLNLDWVMKKIMEIHQ